MNGHVSVLLPESLALLNIHDGGTYVDLTLGRGGTSSEILKKIPNGRLVCFDLDEEAIEKSTSRLKAIGSNFTIVHSNFSNYPEELKKLGISQVDGLTADLGVSSPQFDEADRGFSYKEEAPLDMRMDVRQTLSAYDVVNTYSLHDLTRIFREYGEDKDAYAVSKAIIKKRESSPIKTTTELAELIKESKPISSRLKKGHPAKQIFQAIRIEVNGELDNLKKALDAIPSVIAPKGRVAIISFHSLEDRLVKDKFKELTVVEGNRHEMYDLPSELEEAPFINLTKKPIEAGLEEVENNHRSASAKLRGIERKGENP
ncbi:MAG: 16S rRNA (cytosine(1402)-N(4))-methyltransferase RsmH [Bacilli bacterium]|jgi:16S rRNA (cytosine1402-N4)-methyltransferase|nr:16S rRNA (cytosine(1402)-N(4))-methyltransferase RsmH [Bacilli bacterium]MCH4210586.1 16S rRNA (cytosine(1402)-N(4))-methyltransferase RsmH [Bacilli bacterium]MCH4228544.1 16S rRNA (cytosine(1402)-N(4))-methyltransferase RsmH [Bacilli bacterium]MCH4277320.1 16S rRNA (cytosine(1402)-N(4))-methyltransferase RsmH [Bacilli bacterium]MCI2055232.1 16S rRNA (cytosine(1402)-N(4))-methyltransferase RsmH [Bacilli bacterium]